MLVEARQENRCLKHFRKMAIQNDENKQNLGAQRSRVQSAGKCSSAEQLIADDAGEMKCCHISNSRRLSSSINNIRQAAAVGQMGGGDKREFKERLGSHLSLT